MSSNTDDTQKRTDRSSRYRPPTQSVHGYCEACPECDSTRIETRVQTDFGTDRVDAGYCCSNCGARFDEPVERPRKQSGVPRHGLASRLAEADADDLVTDGGQTVLDRDPTHRQVAQPAHDDDGKPTCPDCGASVGASHGGGKPLPDQEATAFGWSCEACSLTLPARCHGADAPMYVDRMAGLEVAFRDGETRWVAVPARFVAEGGDV